MHCIETEIQIRASAAAGPEGGSTGAPTRQLVANDELCKAERALLNGLLFAALVWRSADLAEVEPRRSELPGLFGPLISWKMARKARRPALTMVPSSCI